MENERLIEAGPWIFLIVAAILLFLRIRLWRRDKAEKARLTEGKLSAGIYEHYKGKKYEVLFVARDCETKEYLVVYQEISGENRIWTRPLKMFLEEVEVSGGKVPRFRFLGN